MKILKIVAIAMGACAMFTVTGCKKNTPEAVAIRVMEALRDGKATPEFLKENCTENAAMLFGLVAVKAGEEMAGAKFSVVETKIDGDKAKVTIKGTGGKSDDKNEDTIDVKKVDGKWKVDIDKEGMMKGSQPTIDIN